MQQPQGITQQQYDTLVRRLDAFLTHKHLGTDSLRIEERDLSRRTRHVLYRCLAPTTANTVAVVGGNLSMPFSGTFVLAGATVDTAGTTGTQTIDVLKNGSTIMANQKISIASGATDSRGSASSIITTGFFEIGDILTFSVTAIQGTPAKGLTIFLRVTETSR